LKQPAGQTRALEDERYRSRQGEVSSLIAEDTLAKLEREIQRLKEARRRGFLFTKRQGSMPSIVQFQSEKSRQKLVVGLAITGEVRAQLEIERDRVLKYPLPGAACHVRFGAGLSGVD